MSLSKAYTTSVAVFEQVTHDREPDLLARLRAIKKKDIGIVSGCYDHVENILDALKVPYTTYEAIDELIEKKEGAPLPRVLFLNCDGAYDGGLDDSETNRFLRKYVAAGRRLVSTDWSLDLMQEAFPGKLRCAGNETTDDVVLVKPANDIGAKLIGMSYAECKPNWWLESSSHPFEIGRSVTPLIVSEELKERYGAKYIAAAFHHGDGEVVHFISHLELQRTKQQSRVKGGKKEDLDEFLAHMKTKRSSAMTNMPIGQLEAAYSSLNTLARLCDSKRILPKIPKPPVSGGAV